MFAVGPSMSSSDANVLFWIVMFAALPLIVPPSPLSPSSVKPLSPEPKLNRIVGVLPLAAEIVIALLVPSQVP